jgi:hypothetical protein
MLFDAVPRVVCRVGLPVNKFTARCFYIISHFFFLLFLVVRWPVATNNGLAHLVGKV